MLLVDAVRQGDLDALQVLQTYVQAPTPVLVHEGETLLHEGTSHRPRFCRPRLWWSGQGEGERSEWCAMCPCVSVSEGGVTH